MRVIFSVLGLLLVVLAVGMLAKKQLATVAPAVVTNGSPPAAAGSPQQQLQQYQRALQESMQAPRPEPETK